MMRDQDKAPKPAEYTPGLDLAACPFCASTNVGFYEHVYAQHFAVKCNLCGAEGPSRPNYEEAGRLWNRRVSV
jgi:Lar family restriction alleviation protein